jgi:hypothetical protein
MTIAALANYVSKKLTDFIAPSETALKTSPASSYEDYLKNFFMVQAYNTVIQHLPAIASEFENFTSTLSASTPAPIQTVTPTVVTDPSTPSS